MPKLWGALKPGDKVAFTSSSSPVTAEDKDRFSHLLNEWGLEIYRPTDSALVCENFPDYFGDQGTPKRRADAIIDALNNEDVKAIFVRGGSGADEVIEHLKRYDSVPPGLPRRGVPLIGFSDATQLQHYLGSIGVVSPAQGPDPNQMIPKIFPSEGGDEAQLSAQKSFASTRQAAEEMRNFLFHLEEKKEFPLVCVNDAARATGEVSGNMVVFNEHSRRSDYSVICDAEYNPILLLEGGFSGRRVEEGIRFAIEHLRSIGDLQNLKAIVLSQSDGRCFFDETLAGSDLREVQSATSGLEIPVFFGAPFGHGPVARFIPIPLHTATLIQIQSSGQALCGVESVRTSEDAEVVRNFCEERSRRSAVSSDKAIGKVEKLFQKIDLEPVHGSGLASGNHDHIACAIKFFHRGVDVPALDGIDLSRRNVLIDFTTFCSFEEWQKGVPLKKSCMEIYEVERLRAFKQAAQMSLMELLKTGQLQTANSVLLLSRKEMPENFKLWLKEFSRDHQLTCDVSCSHAPDFPREKISNSNAAMLNLNVVNLEQSATVSRSPS